MDLDTSVLWGAVEPVVRKYYGLGAKAGTPQYSQIFDVSDGKEAVRHSMEFGGPLPQLPLKAENAPVAGLNIIQGPNKTFQWAVYAGKMTMSYELARDVQYMAIKTVSKSMGRAVRLTPEYLTAQYLDRSYNTSFPATGDGKPLCSTTHLIVGTNSTTGVNALATAAAMAESSAEDMRTQVRTQLGPDGGISGVKIEKWIVPSSLAVTAEKLSRTKQQVGSANNTVSVVSGTDYMVFDYLTNQTRWFGQTNTDNGLFFEWDQHAQFMEDNNISVLNRTYVAFMRFRFGVDDWRNIFGSNAV